MKLKKLHIYGFGQFEDFSISFNENFQVIYGINEAGKSTMMAFIKSVLFGFPTRSKNKYMPEGSKRFGGTVTVATKDYGTITISRVDDNKNVTVYFEDGRTEGAESLATLFKDIDETHFDGIFSFDLDGLQHLEKIQDDELNDFLLGAGMTGDVSVSSIQQRMEKKQQELFRVSGKKPDINQQITVLDTITEKINKWKEKRLDYEDMLVEKKEQESRLSEIKAEKLERTEHARILDKVKAIVPIYEEKKQLQYQLDTLPPYEPFPEDGLLRYEQWQSQLVHIKGEYHYYEKQLKAIIEQLEIIDVNKKILEQDDRLQRIRENESLYHAKCKEKVTLQKEIDTIKEDLQLLVEKLGREWNSSELPKVDTSIAAQENLFSLLDKIDAHEQKKQFFEENYFQTKQKRDELLQEEQHYKCMLLSEIEQNKLQHDLKLLKEKSDIEESMNHIQLAEKSNGWKILVGSFTFVLFSIILILKEELLLGIGAIALAVIFLFMSREFMSNKSNTKVNAKMKKKYELILQQLDRNVTKAEIEAKLREHEEATYTLRAQKTVVQRAVESYEKMTEAYVDWQYEDELLQRKRKELLHHYRFDEKLSTKAFREAFTLLEDGKKLVLQQQRKEDELLQVQEEINYWDEEVKALCHICSVDFEQNWSRVLEKLHVKMNGEKEKAQKRTELEGDKEESRLKVAQWQEKSSIVEDECKQLMEQANVTTEEAFIKKAKTNRQANEIKQKLTIIDSQLTTQLHREDEEAVVATLQLGSKQLHEELLQIEKQRSLLAAEEESVRSRLTNIDVVMKQFEEDGSYSELLQQYELEKSKLNNLAEEWAVLALAANILESTKSRFRNERLPKVIDQATQYFTIFTKHRYDKILAPVNKNSFIVERDDGRRFSPSELSRGTQEQLYLAIRLALANVYPSASTYPLIVDDIFVNFDHVRTERAVEVLRKASEKHQVVFFTCHHHLLTHFTGEEVITLSVKANGIQEEGYEVS
jgi:uncharacterized protein YhaN